jgi:hypothetical protein
MLISNKLNTIIRILTTNLDMQLSDIAKLANIRNSVAHKLVLKLINSGYVVKAGGLIKVLNPNRLTKAWSYCVSIKELNKVYYNAAERPQYLIKTIANAARTAGLDYAFTLFSATEFVSPYVAPSETYIYVKKDDLKKWDVLLRKQNMLSTSREGNVILLSVDEDYFVGVWDAHGSKIVSLPQLYVDLFSFGGRGEEAAEQILDILTKGGKNV